MQTTKQEDIKLSSSEPAQCTVSPPKPGKQPSSHSGKLILKCKFNRRCFDITLVRNEASPLNLEDLTEAIEKETGIPSNKQWILFKGIEMNPPDIKSMSTLDNLNVKTGDQVLILNRCRVGTDDEEREMLEQLLEVVKVTDIEISDLFYKVDQVQHGCVPKRHVHGVLNSLRTQALSLEKRLMGFIKTANGIHFDYRNAVDQARRRQMIDQCQRRLDKVGGLASAIFDRLALANATVKENIVYTVPTKDGPCALSDCVNKGPCK